MKIVVNDIAASKTGALSILKDFYEYLRENDTGNEWIFLLSDHYIEETDRIQVRVLSEVKKGWLHRLKFDLLNGSKYIAGLEPDLYFSMQNTLPTGYKGKCALYVHQPLGFQKIKNFSLFKSEEREYAIYQHFIARLINASVKKADLTIVQTDWMKDAASRKIPSAKVIKIRPTVEDLSRYVSKGQPRNNVFFFPSGDILYKNHRLLYQAAAILDREDLDFSIEVTLSDEELRRILKEVDEKVYSHFNCLGRIPREEVYERYATSVLIFPSYIETFGYPPAEASQLGSLILASDCPFCKDVLGTYENAYYFDPFDAEACASLMGDVMSGAIKQKNVRIDADRENSWKQVVDALVSTAKDR